MKTLRIILIALFISISSVCFADTVNINSANAETLATYLNGVGASKAEAIVAYREEHGPFASIYDLAKVKGIGEKTVEMNLDIMMVSDE